MRSAEAKRRAVGDPREPGLTDRLGSACVGARLLSLARTASAVHMAASAGQRAGGREALSRETTVEAAR